MKLISGDKNQISPSTVVAESMTTSIFDEGQWTVGQDPLETQI